MAKDDPKTEPVAEPMVPVVDAIPSGDGIPIAEKPGTLTVSHEKKDGSKVLLTVITN